MPACSSCYSKHIKCSQRYGDDSQPCRNCLDSGNICSYPTVSISQSCKRTPLETLCAPIGHKRMKLQGGRASATKCPTFRVSCVKIALDFGSSFTKACYCVVYEHETESQIGFQQRRFPQTTKVIMWGNKEEICPTVLAYRPKDFNCTSPLWGYEVERSLDRGEISESDILKYLKPALYSDDHQAAESKSAWHQGELLQKLQAEGLQYNDEVRNGAVSALLNSCEAEDAVSEETTSDTYSSSPSPEVPERGASIDLEPCIDRTQNRHADTIANLWLLFQKCVWRFVVQYIRDELGRELPGESSPDIADHDAFNLANFGDCRVETAITTPASSSVAHVQFAVDVARKAGILNPFPVSEPASAAAYTLQYTFERTATIPETRGFLHVDLGGGSLDLCAVRAMKSTETSESETAGTSRGMRMKELVEGQSSWTGSATINKKFRELAENEINVAAVVTELNNLSKIKKWTNSRFLDKCENLFEEAKRDFDGSGAPTLLPFPELEKLKWSRPMSSDIQFTRQHISISPRLMRQIFEPCLNAMISLIDKQLKRLCPHAQSFGGSRIRRENTVRDVQLCGSGSLSPYLRKKVKAAFETMRYGHEISIRAERGNEAAVMVCKGALILLTDRDFVGERILRRGYGFAFDDIAMARKSAYQKGRLTNCPLTGRVLKKDAVYWLVQVGQRVKGNLSKHLRAERNLKLMDNESRFYFEDRREWGWEIKETLYSSDRAGDMKPGLWAAADNNGISAIATIRFVLYDSDLEHVKVERLKGIDFKSIDYESGIELIGSEMRWSIKFPRSGSFEVPVECLGKDEQIIEKPGKVIDCRGNFKLFRSIK